MNRSERLSLRSLGPSSRIRGREPAISRRAASRFDAHRRPGLTLVLCLASLGFGSDIGSTAPTERAGSGREGTAACRLLLDLESASRDGKLGPRWSVRRVRGAREPELEIIDEEGEGRYLRIISRDGAAFVYRRLAPPPAGDRVLLRWSWRTRTIVPDSDLRRPGRDDSPLRVFVSFGRSSDDDLLREGRSIFYTWGRLEPRGTRFRSHVSERIYVWVLRNAEDVASGWHDERRDLAADYRRAFGGDPPPVRAVGFLADTDQTGASVESELRALCIGPSEEGRESRHIHRSSR